ncbi:hypothetical protein [Arthrobacter sp. H14]|uniref:hypothetical protein n=1 Tax=Arthrobacter sp. H14 TaxID=1312959 RepID=UPI0004B789DF|nr:hypothetical protein [Arthrobacter sp. H14]
MSVSRREVFKWGAVGLAGASLVTVPISTVSAKSASELDEGGYAPALQNRFRAAAETAA